jgi:hypothetical protein
MNTYSFKPALIFILISKFRIGNRKDGKKVRVVEPDIPYYDYQVLNSSYCSRPLKLKESGRESNSNTHLTLKDGS